MSMASKKINRAVAAVRSVAKKVPKVVAVALPAVTVAANVADVAAKFPGDLPGGLKNFVKRYTFIDIDQGALDGSEGMKGAGTLIISAVVGATLAALT